jgi:hypothetical protein
MAHNNTIGKPNIEMMLKILLGFLNPVKDKQWKQKGLG